MSGEIKVTDLHPTLQAMVGGGMLQMEEYDVQATTVGQTQFEIPMVGFDAAKHSLLVFRNSTRVRSANFTVLGRMVTFPSGVEDPSKTIISFVVLKNVVDGSKLEDDFVDEVTQHLAQDATTAAKGHVKLSSNVTSTSETEAATPKAIKTVNDVLTTHLAESMPHQFIDGTTKYRYGLKVNPSKDGLIFVYEEVV